MLKKCFIVFALAIAFLSACGRQLDVSEFVAPGDGVNVLVFENPFNLPDTPHGGNILHAWNMSFVEIIEHLPYIAEAGFGVVQTSPIGAALVREQGMGTFGRWYDLYQPTAFRVGNYLGTYEEFRELTRQAASYGIFIIVDAIPNHTTAYWDFIDPALRDFQPSLFHSRFGDRASDNPWAAPMNFDNRRSFVRCNLLGLWDFYTSREEFQEIYKEFLRVIIDAGASGFRFDAAHHIELPIDPEDIRSDFWPVVSAFVEERVSSHGRIAFQYGETLGGGYRANMYLYSLYEHARFLVTPYAFSDHIRRTVTSGILVGGQNGWSSDSFHISGNPPNNHDSIFGPAFRGPNLGGHVGFATGVVPWVESHDQYGNEGISRHLTDDMIITGWALITARYGTTPLFFIRPGEGFVNSGNMFIPQDDGTFANRWGHDLLYRSPQIAAINRFSNDFINEPEATSTHGAIALIQRGTPGAKTGAVIVSLAREQVGVDLPVQMVDGDYICQVTGASFTVQDGRLTGPDIEATSVVVLRLLG